ncbi:MAG: sigma-70 family RNA polymerase sigma factor [Candidatus Hydrogenedentes bacterium]|nr:sigma-70 family RNA polymerase sigma factor [Candidatus Hydrogenedentota bacterium]
MTSTSKGAPKAADPRFVSTHWTVVLSACAPGSPHAAAALESLCRAYWYPLYAYVRRRGHTTADAQDLTQEFFAQLLEHNWIARGCPPM